MKNFLKKVIAVLERYYTAKAEEQIRIRGWL